MWLLLLCYAALAAGTMRAAAQMPRPRLSVQSWDATSGLPQDSVVATAQTADGFLWLATSSGLARFDGLEFQVFQHSGYPELPKGYINALAASPDGSLWIGSTEGGVAQWSGGRFRSFDIKAGLPSNSIISLAVDGSGRIWAGTSRGLAVFDGGAWTVVGAQQGWQGPVNSVTVGPNGVWACGANLLLHWSAGNTQVLTTKDHLPEDTFVTVYEDAGTGVWLAGQSGNVYLRRGDQVQQVALGEWKGNRGVQSFLRDREGRFWLGSFGGGLARWDGSTLHVQTEQEGWHARTVYNLLNDREGNLWVGTISGLYRIRTDRFATLTAADGLRGGLVRAVFEDADGTVWIGTDSALHRYRDGKLETLADTAGGEHAFLSAARVGPDLLFGTVRSGVLQQVNDRLETYPPATALGKAFVAAIFQASDGRLWVGVNGQGIQVFDHGTLAASIGTKDALPSTTVRGIRQAGDGTIWVNTFSGVAHLVAGRWKSYTTDNGLPSSIVMALHEDAQHRMWAATMDGIGYFDGDRFVPVDAEGGHLSSVFSILEDEQHGFWLGTAIGVVHIVADELKAATERHTNSVQTVLYGREAGMPSAQCSGGTMNVSTRLRNGDLLFGTADAVVWIRPSMIGHAGAPVAYVSSTVIDGQPQPGGSLTIPPGARTAEFHYTSPNLSAPEKLQFRYKLDGFDPDWVDAGSRRAAYYTNLPAGRYRFRVQARNQDGVWSTTDAALPVRARPHFWQTWWFVSLSGLLIIFLLWLFYRQRIARMEERLAAVLDERTRIAREIHDTYLQGFTGVTLQIAALKNYPAAAADARVQNKIEQILKQADSSLTEARQSVWNLRAWDPEIAPLASVLEETAREAAAATSVEVHCDASGFNGKDFTVFTCDQLRRVVQEAVTNAVRHSQCSCVHMRLAGNRHNGTLAVADDGCGFRVEDVEGQHFGLRNLKERAATIGGRIEIQSAPGDGTKIVLTWRVRNRWWQNPPIFPRTKDAAAPRAKDAAKDAVAA